MYRGLRLWASAVTAAGSLEADMVAKALDAASLEDVQDLGQVDPKECLGGCD